MPNTNPIIRAMDWGRVKEELPDDVSIHLPDGDPLENHSQIKREVERMNQLGPRGRNEVQRFVDGKITADELDRRLEEISRNTNQEQLEEFRMNLRKVVRVTDRSYWRDLVPLMDSSIQTGKLIEVADELNSLELYEEDKEKETVKATN